MTKEKFEELTNLYLDNELSRAEHMLLKSALKTDPERQRLFKESCKLHKAAQLALFERQRVMSRGGSRLRSNSKRLREGGLLEEMRRPAGRAGTAESTSSRGSRNGRRRRKTRDVLYLNQNGEAHLSQDDARGRSGRPRHFAYVTGAVAAACFTIALLSFNALRNANQLVAPGSAANLDNQPTTVLLEDLKSTLDKPAAESLLADDLPDFKNVEGVAVTFPTSADDPEAFSEEPTLFEPEAVDFSEERAKSDTGESSTEPSKIRFVR